MSTIKTMKGQAIEAGATVNNWPQDGIIKWFIPADDGDGTTAVEQITETILEGTASFITATSGATCTIDFGEATTLRALSNYGEIGNSSFVMFYVGDTSVVPAGLSLLQYGADTGQFIRIGQFGAAVNKLNDSEGVTSLAGMTDTATDQLLMLVVDRENGTFSAYEGTDGTTLVDSAAISTSGSILVDRPDNGFDSASLNGDLPIAGYAGAGLLVFPNGIPTNFAAMMSYIADELRAGRKRTWMANFVADYML